MKIHSDFKKALYFKPLSNKKVQCRLCPKFCVIPDGGWGNCNARKNIDGNLMAMTYAAPAAVAVDPVEKKPLFHFLPGSSVFSVGTFGCNLHCDFCQNYDTSQARPEQSASSLNSQITPQTTPQKIIDAALDSGCSSVGYTYNEPYIFYEYVLETAKLARKAGLKNIMVSNGFCAPAPVKRLYRYVDAANIDLKAFSENFYVKYCDARLQPVLDTIKLVKSMNIHLELTNLVIPGLNDSDELLSKLCGWIDSELGSSQILHFSAFHPCFKMLNVPRTELKTLLRARKTALAAGLKFVYLGNVRSEDNESEGSGSEDGENTYCPSCNKMLICRQGYMVSENIIRTESDGRGLCPVCRAEIAGFFG